MAGTAPSEYIPTLDGWRAIAILSVVGCHLSDGLFAPTGLWPSTELFTLTRYGAFGVDLFFGISGYLITSRLLRARESGVGARLRGFYVRRFFRILPPYLLFVAVLAVLAAGGWVPASGRELLSCVFFLRNYLFPASAGGDYTGHLWSIAVEEHFYLIWPLLLLSVGARRGFWLAGAGAIGVAIWRAFEFRHQWVAGLLPGVGFWPRTDIRLDGLLAGAVLALGMEQVELHARVSALTQGGRGLVAPLLVLVCLGAQPPFFHFWVAGLIPLALAATVLHPETKGARWLEMRPLVWVGRISYSLYLWNSFFMLTPETPRALGMRLQEYPWQVPLTFAAAYASYRWVERPLIRWGYRVAPAADTGRW